MECPMIPNFVKELQAEKKRLEAELQRQPLYRRLEAVQEALGKLLPLYGEAMGSTASNLHVHDYAVVAQSPSRLNVVRPTRRGSMSSKVSEVALRHFEETGRRATSGDILEIARKNGIEIDSPKPQSQVASILSHHPLFDNTGDSHGLGYGLSKWSGGERPSEQISPDTADVEIKETAHGHT
jgi:hypothetical protein